MKRLLLILIAVLAFSHVQAQQYGLFGTETMFDAFENVSQKSFTLNSSRQFSTNFFLPYFGANAANKGPADNIIRKLTQTGEIDTRELPLGLGQRNHFFENSNIYVAALRVFKSYKYQKEMGFSWQIRSDVDVRYTNESLAVFDSYTRFPKNELLTDIFNTNGYQQSYHQFSFSYRENYDKRLAFGFKASILSGILYNSLDINNSSLFLNKAANTLDLGFAGQYRSSFQNLDDIKPKTFFPTFKNPGFSLSLGTNYTTKQGLFLMGNIKDLGFIWWRSNTTQADLLQTTTIDNLKYNQDRTNEKIKDVFLLAGKNKKFLAATNAKADFYISKNFTFYKPAFIVSKNLFYQGGDAAFVNTFYYQEFSASITPDYNFTNIFMLGLQGKYQTPNFEVFLGSDNLLRSAYTAKGLIEQNAQVGAGTTGNGASIYFGLAFKFGYVVNHPQFADIIPGINDGGDNFFKHLFSGFKKR
ncbi:hypothetical protein ACVWYG_000393 [Pedobacter sp. UYEF25]